MNLLLIDNDPQNVARLSYLPANITVCQSLSIPMHMMRANDCIILNIETALIPESELLHKLSQMAYMAPVVITTAASNIAQAVKLMQAGACDIVETPFTRHRIQHAIAKALPTLKFNAI